MISDFGEGWVGSPIERWLVIFLKSGVLFWIGGLAAWLWHTDADLLSLWHHFMTADIKPVQALLLIFILTLLLAMVASILKRFDFSVLRFLEGYGWPQWLRTKLMQRQARALKTQRERLKQLAQQAKSHPLTAKEQAEYIRLDWQLMCIPYESTQLMPTRLGNLLRAIELKPRIRYGLDAIICWPHLWLVLPDDVKIEIVKARHQLDTAVRIWMWSVLFLIWGYWAWWAIPLGLIAALLDYHWILQAAKTYGHLIEASFNLHRHSLYRALDWPIPENPEQEKAHGEQLTRYLFRGLPPTRINKASTPKGELTINH